jgi:MGT family glycosyltransferase
MTSYLVYTPSAPGHVFPLVPGLLALVDRGHRVEVLTSPDLVDTLTAVGLHASPVDARLVALKRQAGARREPDSLEAQLDRAPLEREDLERAVARVRPDALLVDVNTYGAQLAAELSGLPWAKTLPSLLPYPGRGIPPYSLGLAPRTDLVGRVRDAVLWKVVERAFAKAILPQVNRMRAEAGLPAYRSPLDHLLGAQRLIVLTGEPLEYPRVDTPDRVSFVGGQPWDPPSEPLAWVEEPGDPWVLVTCSTDYLADQRLAETAVEALRDLPVRVLVTLADAYDAAALPTAPNVRVERFVPHAQVLPHAAAVVSPSGMGIVTKAHAHGVPIVAVPFERDQPEVARRVTEAGLGVVLPAKRLRADRLRTAVEEAMTMTVPAASTAGHAGRFADAAEEVARLCSR